MELNVLSCLVHDRQAYEDLKDVLDSKDFSDLANLIVDEATNFYETDPDASHVDQEILLSRVGRTSPTLVDSVQRVLNNLEDVSVPNVINEYVDLRLESLGRRMSQLLASGRVSNDTAELMEQWHDLKERREEALGSQKEDRIFDGLSVADVVDFYQSTNLTPIYPEQLNAALGYGVPPGTHIVVFARPEAGKTMFCVNLAGGFVKNGKKALYIGNEDPCRAIQQRLISNITQLTKEELDNDQEYAQDLLAQNSTGSIIFADLHPGSTANVRSLVAAHRPDVVLVDQIRNLMTPGGHTKVESLEYIAQQMRNIAKEFNCVVVSVTQAGDSADNKLELGMGDVDFSNTGIPATADVMIGIGVTPMLDKANKRRLSLPKNKVSGTHEAIDVDVNPELSEVY